MIDTPESGYVRPDQLNIDHTYQRPLEPKRFSTGGDLSPFRPYAVGSLSVSRRIDDTLWVLDGQHRVEGARRAGHSRTLFPAQIYTGLSIDEEAAIFGKLNKFRSPHPIYRFRARVVAGDKTACVLNEIVAKHGWKIAAGTEKGAISAVSALEWLYDGGKIRKDGELGDVVDRTLMILTAAFGYSSHGVNAHLIKGLGLVILRHDSVDIAKLVNEMGKVAGGPNGLFANAKALKGIRGGDLPNSVAEIIVELHNSRRRTQLLPQWTRS